jgi:hypothetical protein
MKPILRICRAVALVLPLAVVVPVHPWGASVACAQAGPTSAEAVRPAIATPLAAAQDLIKARNYGEALARIRDAESVADRTPFENFVIEQARAAAAAGAGDAALMLKSSEALVATGRLLPAEQVKAIEGIANAYYRREDYAKAAQWATRYAKEGGTDPQMRVLLARSLYLDDKFADAATVLRADIDADEKAGRTPSQERVRMLASSYHKLNDSAGYLFALEKMLAYYPKKEYWADAIRRVEKQPGFSDRLTLEVLRLMHATGNLNGALDYVALAQLALQSGLPAEAKKVLDEGFASGVLGSGAEAEQQRKLRATATKQVAEDERALAQSAKDAAAAKDGNPLVNVGFAFVAAGQFDKGLALMEQGLQKGGVRRPDEARLHLGIAYFAAGQKGKAVDAFKAVQGTDGAADLARLWAIHAQRSAN